MLSALCALALLAPLALLASDLPRPAAWPAAMLALAQGAAQARRWRRRARTTLVVDAVGRAQVDGRAVQAFQVHWRGPLAFVRWRDEAGRRQRRDFWPDTLPPALRRELRLRARPAADAPGKAGMAH